MYSKFNAVEDPAIAFEPKLLMEDWIQTLATEKTMPCSPAGTPIFKIRISSEVLISSFLKETRIGSSSCSKNQMTSSALTPFATTVAIPAPATSMWKPATSRKFKITFTTPETINARSGRFVSPILRRIDAPKS